MGSEMCIRDRPGKGKPAEDQPGMDQPGMDKPAEAQGGAPHKRPRGRAPDGKEWDEEHGQWKPADDQSEDDQPAEDEALRAARVAAEGGDASAMCALGYAYRDGAPGLKKDRTQAFTWFKRAADLKDPCGLANCGVFYVNGWGVKRSQGRALIMLGQAAGLGSEQACALLGRANAEGLDVLDKNPQEATRWFREMQRCKSRDASEKLRERAAAWLRDHP